MSDTTTNLLADYVSLDEAAKQPGMPCRRTLQRWAAARQLPGLVYVGRRPFLSVPAFRAGIEARMVKPLANRRRK